MPVQRACAAEKQTGSSSSRKRRCSLPGGSQIFQQCLAHHRVCRLGKRQPQRPAAGRFQRAGHHTGAAECLHHQFLRDGHAQPAAHERHDEGIVPEAIYNIRLHRAFEHQVLDIIVAAGRFDDERALKQLCGRVTLGCAASGCPSGNTAHNGSSRSG